MVKHIPGTLSPLTGSGGADSLSAANRLVQSTLARHGLVPDHDGTAAPAARTWRGEWPGLTDLSALSVPGMGMPAAAMPEAAPIPAGAEFRLDTFACESGSRAVRTYVPASVAAGAEAAGVLVMLHGCTQNAADFAVGTGMNALAEQHRIVVLYPEQARGANARTCWNWFSKGDQRRDRGEPAIIAGLTRAEAARHGIGPDRTFVAGLSAGAAMAVILGETWPDVFGAVGAHSGLPYAAAADVPSAFAAMAGNGAERGATPGRGAAPRTIVFHGTADTTVHPVNGERIVGDVLQRGGAQTVQTEEQGRAAGRPYRRTVSSGPDGAPDLEHWVIEALGHAWSGGRPGGSYTDEKGPDASAEMVRFFLAGSGG